MIFGAIREQENEEALLKVLPKDRYLAWHRIFQRNNSPHRWQAFVLSCSLHSLSQNGPAGGKLCFEGQALGLLLLIHVSVLSVYRSFPQQPY